MRTFAAVSALFAGLLGLVACSFDSEPDEFGAQVMCEQFLEDQLKSPGTAEFDTPTREAAGFNTWKISGAVDSENSFGALVRIDYVCTVKSDGAETWTLVDLQHEQR